MAKGRNTQKTVKKKSEKTLKEKRKEKKEKKSKKSMIQLFIQNWLHKDSRQKAALTCEPEPLNCDNSNVSQAQFQMRNEQGTQKSRGPLFSRNRIQKIH